MAHEPDGHGWQMKEGQLEIYWTNQVPAPDAVMELVCCGCKGLCQTRRCSCVGNGLLCMEACTCQDNCINCVSSEEDDGSDGNAGVDDNDDDKNDS